MSRRWRLDAAIARVEALPKLNAVVIKDYELAREHAKKLFLGCDARKQATDKALWGLPFVLWDLGLSMAGTVTSNGCRFFKDAVASQDSTLVMRYKAAGLNIFGKTASPEFGMTTTTESKLYGVTPNPEHRAYHGRFFRWDCRGGGGRHSARGPCQRWWRLHPHTGRTLRPVRLKPSRGRVPAGPGAGWRNRFVGEPRHQPQRARHSLAAGLECWARVRLASATSLMFLGLP
jgi:amidase/aspartyl-tRNA(Asn)/glutamyl-tRNA(Gln) amidotransferase subunit A